MMSAFKRVLWTGVGAFGALLLSFAVVPLPERLSTKDASVLEYADGSTAHVTLSEDDRWRIRASTDRVDARYPEALVAFEDRRFYVHPGVDPIAFARAMFTNLAAGRVVSGGSTLTMQVVRVLEPRPRTLRSKLIEAWRAMQLEAHFSKTEILELYMTYAPFGGNVEGVEAASWMLFGHGPELLDVTEIATLIAIPQSPARRSPSPSRAPALRAARDHVGRALVANGAWSAKQAEPLQHREVPTAKKSYPKELPLLASAYQGKGIRLRTTLRPEIQRELNRQMAQLARQGESEGIWGHVAIVMEHETGEIHGLVPNSGGWESGARIPMHEARRSVGSTLKPFLYAMALEQGRLLPEQLRKDRPISYRGYTPANFGESFAGVVTAESSLIQSLNIPFVELLEEVGVESFLGKLSSAGLGHLAGQQEEYGLSMIVGGVEASPIELIGLYGTLAQEGRLITPHWLPQEASASAIQVWSRESTWLTRRALSKLPSPAGSVRSERLPTIHWKTGTSFGFRDAWAIGSGPRYTALVWRGNPDRTPARGLVGRRASGGPLFDILQSLEREQGPPQVPPDHIGEVEVCALSGHLPGEACEVTQHVEGITDRIPTTRCPFHRRILVDEETGERRRPGCRGDHPVRSEIFVSWPDDVAHWLAQSGEVVPVLPPLAEGCIERAGEVSLSIANPPSGEILWLAPGVPVEEQEVPFQSAGASGRVNWFINDTWLGEVAASESLWWTPEEGTHELVVQDGTGRVSRRQFEVVRSTGW